MRNKFYQFMYGRYGVDSFSKFLVIAGCICLFLTWFIDSALLILLGWGAILYSYFRILSKNHAKRSAENQTYLRSYAKICNFWNSQKSMFAQRKTHHIYKCSTCGQKIRIPRGKGRIEIRCPKCNTTFIKNS